MALPYEDNKFDLIVTLMTLHHIKNVEQVLREFRRILKPGGCIIIREHDHCYPEFSVFLDIVHGLYCKVVFFFLQLTKMNR